MKKDLNNKPNHCAFTLAEVLITLGIIGIVAAMTLPALITNYQKKETIAKLKEAYSILNQATQQSTIINGDITDWDFGQSHFDYNESRNFLEKYIVPYLKVTGKCFDMHCKATTKTTMSGMKNDAYLEKEGATGRSIFLANGMQVWAYTDSDQEPKLGGLVVDFNGHSKPNVVGKDIFFFALSNNSLQVKIQGADLIRSELFNNRGEGCNKTATNVAGRWCGALIMKDGWKIKDDYPW